MITNFNFFEEHVLHSNLASDRFRCAYLHIPVNASCWGKTIFQKAGFQPDTKYTIPPEYKIIVFLRDPISRWLSGLATWLTYRLPQHTPITEIRDNRAALDILFDSVRQDDHTERQAFFLQNLDFDQIEFWWTNETLGSSMNDYFAKNFNTDITDCLPENRTTLEGGKLIPRNYFKQVFDSNPQYQQRVKEFFQEDYYLIRKIPFRNTTTPIMCYYDD